MSSSNPEAASKLIGEDCPPAAEKSVRDDPRPSSSKEAEPEGDNTEEEAEEGTVTMLDVLQDETELEEDAKAVLGAADEKNCTYLTGGYMKRQPLYACLTCLSPDKALESNGQDCGADLCAPRDVRLGTGVCLACSYHCHEGHDLVELYTKRRFKCDCGNVKFQTKCKLEEKKSAENVDNLYNQNFRGLYCICHRPYPDSEDPISDQMIQCIICEDWFHGRHLGLPSKPPADNLYSEMICKNCVEHHKFLLAYKNLAVSELQKSDSTQDVDVTGEAVENAEGCPYEHLKENDVDVATMFMVEDWRSHLCKCSACEKRYSDEEVDFLTDPEDTVHHYEAQSKKEVSSQYEEGLKALSEMDRVKQVEAIQSYNQMKGNLMEYLQKFASNGKVVRQEDIAEFFTQMKANKRQKVEVPNFCR